MFLQLLGYFLIIISSIIIIGELIAYAKDSEYKLTANYFFDKAILTAVIVLGIWLIKR